jgi:hypothetical protein
MKKPTNKRDTSRMLRCTYTNMERLELGKELAEEHGNLGKTTADFDNVKANFKSKITAHEARIVDLSVKVSSGYRIEDVKCTWTFDKPVAGKKELYRNDSNELVETADMTEQDRQIEIELKPPEETPAGISGDGVVAVAADKA